MLPLNFFENMSATSWAIYLGLASILLTLMVKEIVSTFQFHRFAIKHDCKPARSVTQYDKPFGLILLFQMTRTYRERTLLSSWRERASRTGTTFNFFRLGQRFFVTLDPENIKTIFSTSFDAWGHGPTRKAAGKPLIGNGIFASDGAEWHTARALLRPSFAKSQIHDLDMLEHHFQTFLSVLPVDGSPTNLQELFKSLSMDVITDMLFGWSMQSLSASKDDNHEAIAFSEASEYAQKIIWRNFSLGWVGRWIPDLKDWRARRLLHRTVNRIVRQVLLSHPEQPLELASDKKEAKKRYVFLEHLAQRTRDPDVLRDQLMSGLLGGRDTTSSLLSNLFYVIARNPTVWGKLQAEVALIPNQPPTLDDIQHAKYARNCLQESLRLHPVVPINTRYAKVDTVLPRGGGPLGDDPVAIPQGSNIYIAVYSLHRRKDIYGEDSDTFRPERWDEGLRPGWAYVPFGGGPRLCIGQEFAMTEAMFFLIRMVQVFSQIRPVDWEPWRENLSITLNCAEGCRVYLDRLKAA